MSHIHLPDGVLPVWLWVVGYIVLALYLLFFSIYYKKHNMGKKIALVGVLAALMLVGMSIEIIPPFYHLNLAVLSGIILGPVLSVFAIFSANLILAFLGHGGITVVGLNTVLISLESIIAYFGFKFLKSKFKNIFISAFIASFIALFISSWAAVGTIYLGTRDISLLSHHHDHVESVEETHKDKLDKSHFDIRKFIMLIMSFGILGWMIESTITAFIINYISRIRPDIVENNGKLA